MRLFLRPSLLLLTLALPLAIPLAIPLEASAQGAPEAEATAPGIRFNGLGRTYLQQTDLGGAVIDNDTLTADRLTDGNFLLDLAVNAQPNRVTEVQGVVRLRNEFGGFFGAGATVEIRELWARGIVADAVRYHVGDMNLALTPYTLFLSDEDGTVNTPEVFQAQREVIDYENFYTGDNERRLQGANLDFGLAFDQAVESVDAKVFLARLRATDFRTRPTRLIGGGQLGLTSSRVGPYDSQVRLGTTLASTWDDLESGEATLGIRNHVLTFDADVTLLGTGPVALNLVGEAGSSDVERVQRVPEAEMQPDPLVESSDTFFEIGLRAAHASTGFGGSVMFIDVGPEFYSAAAQSKRVDYTRSLSTFNRVGSGRAQRRLSLFDLSRDAGIYTSQVGDQLMAYDPRYSNVLPYGRATPNRRGVRLDADYAPLDGPIAASVGLDLLTEIRGQGTTELKDFVRLRASADVPVGRLAGLDRMIGLTFGTQVENTSRGGNEFEVVDLTSVLLEAGLAAEVYDRIDVLLGATIRTSDGRDYVPQIADFNVVRDFPAPFVTDDSESLLGAGLRYRFKEDVYLTVQVQRFSYGRDATPDADYDLGQVFALYSMSF